MKNISNMLGTAPKESGDILKADQKGRSFIPSCVQSTAQIDNKKTYN